MDNASLISPILRLESDPETPQPKHSRYQLRSTRSRIPQPDFGLSMASSSHTQHSSSASDAGRRGFSLSYLRRAPELSLLASRLVRAVTRRRILDDYAKKGKNWKKRGYSSLKPRFRLLCRRTKLEPRRRGSSNGLLINYLRKDILSSGMDPFENVRMFQLPVPTPVDYGNPPLVLMIPFLAVQILATTTTKVIFLILCITKRPTSLLTPDFQADYIEAAIKSNTN